MKKFIVFSKDKVLPLVILVAALVFCMALVSCKNGTTNDEVLSGRYYNASSGRYYDFKSNHTWSMGTGSTQSAEGTYSVSGTTVVLTAYGMTYTTLVKESSTVLRDTDGLLYVR